MQHLRQRRCRSLIRFVGKKRIHVAVSLQDVHDLENITDVAKEDYITAEWERAQIPSEFGTGPAQRARKRSHLCALSAQCSRKSSRDRGVRIRLCDVVQYVQQVVLESRNRRRR